MNMSLDWLKMEALEYEKRGEEPPEELVAEIEEARAEFFRIKKQEEAQRAGRMERKRL